MSNPVRRFTVPEGRVVTLPLDLCPGPGQTNMRLLPGAEIDLDGDRAVRFGRYLNLRLKTGDLVELDASKPPNANAIKPESLTPSSKPIGDISIATGMPAPKE